MPQASLGLLNLWSINLEVGIENEKRVKSVPQASLGGQSVKCSGRTNEPPEKFTFYFAHAKATPRNAKARHGRAHLLKLPKLPPPTHPPHPPRPLVLLNTPTFCLKPRQAGTWNPSALNREISGDILKQCNFSILFPPFTYLYFQPSFVWHPFLYQGGGNWTLTTYCAINNQLQRGTPNAIEMIMATNFLFLNLFSNPFPIIACSCHHWLAEWFMFLRLVTLADEECKVDSCMQ